MRITHILKFHNALHLLCDCVAKNILLHGREAVRVKGEKFHHKICCAPKCSTLKSLMDEVDSNTLMLLSNLHMNCPHNLVLWLGRKNVISGRSSDRRGSGLGCFGTIPNVLELEAKGNGRAIWVKPMQNAIQKLSEVVKVCVFM